MNLAAYQSLFSTLWVVWFFILFTGIIVAVMRPRKRTDYVRAGSIPFQDESPARQRRDRPPSARLRRDTPAS